MARLVVSSAADDALVGAQRRHGPRHLFVALAADATAQVRYSVRRSLFGFRFRFAFVAAERPQRLQNVRRRQRLGSGVGRVRKLAVDCTVGQLRLVVDRPPLQTSNVESRPTSRRLLVATRAAAQQKVDGRRAAAGDRVGRFDQRSQHGDDEHGDRECRRGQVQLTAAALSPSGPRANARVDPSLLSSEAREACHLDM